jgi:ligand-binding SRPBCC domain-containing protein
MTSICLQTIITAPIDICFDLSRSIDLHQFTTKHTHERAIDGKTFGLIEKDEFVTWEATHFFLKQKLTSKIIEMDRPLTFTDVMIKGAFKSIWHRHSFIQNGQQTIMQDDFRYEVPFGILGSLFNKIILKNYMTSLLAERNETIKQVAETGNGENFFDTSAFVIAVTPNFLWRLCALLSVYT